MAKKKVKDKKTILKAVTDETFQKEVLESALPAVVEFGANWCGPCKAIAPIMEELADEYEGRVGFVRIDLEDNPVAPKRFGVRAIPTLMVFVDGESVEQIVGAVPKFFIAKRVEDATGLEPVKKPQKEGEPEVYDDEDDYEDIEEDGDGDDEEGEEESEERDDE